MKLLLGTILLLLLIPCVNAAITSNCTQSTTTPQISCTIDDNTVGNNVSSPTFYYLKGNGDEFLLRSQTCAPNFTDTATQAQFSNLENNKTYYFQEQIKINCSGADYYYNTSTITTYECYPGDIVPPGQACVNNTLVPSNSSIITQVLWSVAPTTARIGDYVNFQVQFQTLGTVGVALGNCTLLFPTQGLTFSFYSTPQNGTYTTTTSFLYSGNYAYYANCTAYNVSNITGTYSGLSPTRTLTVLGIYTEPTFTANTSPLTNYTFGNTTTYSPAAAWNCTDPMGSLQHGDVWHGCMCPFVLGMGPELFFGLMLLAMILVTYIKTRLWEAAGMIALMWTGVFAVYFPPVTLLILGFGVAVGLGCLVLALFTKEQAY
jgi:hypothetical protein